ncbi:MAG: hypothetical protein GVY24_03030 [Planctomycetes bacterium]|jgi:hypothetical protein|nr:hypothetical protein [Planctomycetota bacterium]
MCTVTIVPLIDPHGGRTGFRIASNRDESRRRPPAHPPQSRAFGLRRAILPIDPTGGGTWIAVNDAGLAMTLLNRNPGDMRGRAFPDRPSRGTIIPDLLGVETLASARARVEAIAPDRYAPFRLVASDGERWFEAVSEAQRVTLRDQPLDRPVMFTSSGLGDAVVEGPRRELFEGWFGDDAGAWPAQQETFHRHRWEDRPALSVCMSRDDARSVSLTVVTVTAGGVSLTYHGAPPDESAEDVTHRLPRAACRERQP